MESECLCTQLASPKLAWFSYYSYAFKIVGVLSGFPGGSDGKASACNMGHLGSIPGSGRSSGEGTGTPLQYPCRENPMDGGAWEAIVHGLAKSRTRLSDFTFLSFKSLSVAHDSLWLCGPQSTRLLWPWSSPGKNTGVGCHFLLQGIFPTQGSNPRLLCVQIDRQVLHH